MEIDENLKKLISEWTFRSGREAFPGSFLENPRLPESLLNQITTVEPFRSQAIKDASVYWSMPSGFGFGMEVLFPAKVEIVAFRDWSETVQNLTAQMEYCDRMDGMDCSRYDVKLERVGREAGDWRIIEIFSDEERPKMNKILEMMKEFFAKPDNQN
ncbi:MAG: hypothetical protein ABWZ66_04345 [Pyrinomonadaceae bacterium]